MNDRKKDTLNKIWRTCVLLQTALYELDNIQDDVIFVRQNKPKLKNTIAWIEKLTNELTENFSTSEADEYVKHIAELEKFMEKYTLNF